MADRFDRFLKDALAPPSETADRAFLARVQARIALDEHLRSQRRRALATLMRQSVALLAIAAAVAWLARSSAVASVIGDESGVGLTALIAGFAFATWALAGPGRSAPLMKLNGA